MLPILNIDIGTVYFFGALLGLLLVGLMGFVVLRLTTYEGYGLWLASIACYAAGLSVLSIYGVSSTPWAVALFNLLFMGNATLALLGTGRFVGRRLSAWTVVGPLALGMAAILAFSFFADARLPRILLLSAALALTQVLHIRVVRSVRLDTTIGHAASCLVFFAQVYVVWTAIRMGFLIGFEAHSSPGLNRIFQIVTYAVVSTCNVGFAFAYLTLTFARTEARSKGFLQSLSELKRSIDEHAIVAVSDRDGRILEVNDHFCEISRYAREELIGRDHRIVKSGAHPKAFYAHLWSEILAGRKWHGEICNRAKDGSFYWVASTVVPIAAVAGRAERFITIQADITQRKRAEEGQRVTEQRFRELVDSTDAIVWEADAVTFTFTEVSANTERLLGFPVADWLQPGFWAKHIHPDDREQAVQFCADCTGRLENHAFEYRFVSRDGRVVWLRDDVTVVALDGTPRWLRGLMIDITATRELEQQLRQSQKLEAIGTLASGIAHDFNNILTGIYGFTSLARESAGDNEELCDYLDEIRRAGNRAAELVRQILAFSRKRGGDEAMGPVQLGLAVDEAIKLLRATSPSSIEFETHLAPGLPEVQGNATQLHQVAMNLGTNAVQAMRDRPGRLAFRLDRFEVDEALTGTLSGLLAGPHVRLTVADTGAGMDAATRDRVFEPFFTTKAPGEGTGLGLSVVHGIVQSHRGAIRLTSAPGRGSKFEVFLPVGDPVPRAAAEVLGAAMRGEGERILIVDDEESIARAGELTLRRLGYTATGENHVLQALAHLERDPHAFDLVVSDQTMPLLTGLEFASRLRDIRPELPVVLVSGHSAALTPEGIRAAGVREVLPKPYTTEVLAAAIRRSLPAHVTAQSI